MALFIIPTSPGANQSFISTINNNEFRISIRQFTENGPLFSDIDLNGSRIISGKICINNVPLNADAYLDIPGKLFWFDTEGNKNPTPDLLGTRFLLLFEESGT